MTALLLALGLATAGMTRPDGDTAAPVDTGPPVPAGQLRRFAVVVGSNQGSADREVLRYAVDDARSVLAVLEELGGVRPADAVLLEDPTWMELDAALAHTGAAVREARRGGARTEVVLYYSGHSDETALLLGDTPLPYGILRQALATVPADVRVTILDSCASGAVLRSKGGVRQPPFLVDRSNSVTGEAFLTSSTATEASQESDRLGGSFFTFHLVAALRGAADADQDGLVTLSEAYQFTFRETRESTEGTLAGPQHPNYALDLTGQGDFVMTDLRAGSARLRFGDGLDGTLWVVDDDGDLYAEVDKVVGTPMGLSVPPGTWQVILQARPTRWKATVELTDGEVEALDGGDFVRDGAPLVDTRTRGAAAPTRPPPSATRAGGIQVVHGVGSPRPSTRIEGVAWDVLQGTWHSLRGVELSTLAGVVRGDVTGAQLSGGVAVAGGEVQGVQLSSLGNLAGSMPRGAQLSGLFNVALGDTPEGRFGIQATAGVNVGGGSRRGAQLAGLLNTQRGNLAGGQWAGLGNVSGGQIVGAQLAGLFNVAGGSVRGLQGAGLFNRARRFDGAQLAMINVGNGAGFQGGVINVAGALRGTQLGLINVARQLDGEAIGLLNVIGDGYHAWEAYTDDVSPVSTGFKLGSRHLYTAFNLGWDPVTGEGVAFSAGLGVHLEQRRLWFDVDLLAGMTEAQAGAVGFPSGVRLALRPTLGARLIGPVGIYVGPTVNVQLRTSDEGTRRGTWMPTWGMGEGQIGWVGYVAGVRVVF